MNWNFILLRFQEKIPYRTPHGSVRSEMILDLNSILSRCWSIDPDTAHANACMIRSSERLLTSSSNHSSGTAFLLAVSEAAQEQMHL